MAARPVPAGQPTLLVLAPVLSAWGQLQLLTTTVLHKLLLLNVVFTDRVHKLLS